jgi:regulation of enolase protein 1 (concanavalin A-like superfamily)
VDHTIEAFGATGWRWLNEPATWSASDGALQVTTDRDTDFWRTTHYGFVRDTGHVLGIDRTGDFELSVTFAGDYTEQFDQAGIALRIDERNWIKSGIELVDGQQQLSAVVTRDVSDWSVVALPDGAERVTVKAARTGDTVTISYGLNGAPPATMLRLAYFPTEPSVLAGVMCASPTGKGFTTRFENVGF